MWFCRILCGLEFPQISESASLFFTAAEQSVETQPCAASHQEVESDKIKSFIREIIAGGCSNT